MMRIVGTSQRELKNYLPFIERIARKIKSRFHTDLDLQELVSYGFIGLKEAMSRFDPQMKVSFETFSYYRVRGAILDGIFNNYPLSRHLAKKLKMLRCGSDYMEGVASDLAGTVDRNVEKDSAMLKSVLVDLSSIHYIVRGTGGRGDDEVREKVEVANGDAHEKPVQLVMRQEILSAVEKLPSNQAKLMKLYYFEDMTLEEAGRKLGFTKSWASKLHNSAIKRLRIMMERKLEADRKV